jgi:transcriptional regulator with XRE-family HTH domain
MESMGGERWLPAWSRAIHDARKERLWSVKRLAAELIKEGRRHGENPPQIESLLRTIYRWESGTNYPDEAHRWLLAKVFHTSEERLFGPEPDESLPARVIRTVEEIASVHAPSGPVEDRAAAAQGDPDPIPRREFIQQVGGSALLALGLGAMVPRAAGVSLNLLDVLDAPGVSIESISDATNELRRISTSYLVQDKPHQVLQDLSALCDRLAALLQRRQQPRHSRDLHVLLGVTCLLLGSASHDLGYPREGMVQANCALRSARLAGHFELMTWSYCTKAMISLWAGWPGDAIAHAQRARAEGATGVGAVRLSGLEARSHARMGDHDQAIKLLNDVQTGNPSGDTLIEFGPVFSLPLARQHYYHAAVHNDLSNWRAAEADAEIAVTLCDAPQRWSVTGALARIHLAVARLHRDGPEGAVDAVNPILSLRPILHQVQMQQEFARLRSQIVEMPDSAPKRYLDEAIRSCVDGGHVGAAAP